MIWLFRDIPAVPLLHVSCGYCRLHMSNLKMKHFMVYLIRSELSFTFLIWTGHLCRFAKVVQTVTYNILIIPYQFLHYNIYNMYINRVLIIYIYTRYNKEAPLGTKIIIMIIYILGNPQYPEGCLVMPFVDWKFVCTNSPISQYYYQAFSSLILIYHIPAVPFVQRPPFRRLHMSYLNAFVVGYNDLLHVYL